MKILTILFFSAILIGCNQNPSENQEVEVTSTVVPTIDTEAELAAIENMRQDFISAINEKRYDDLAQYSSPGMISVRPGSAEWQKYYKEREASLGQFSYDSIRMNPKETVILNDSMAYDFGQSRVYYTDRDGNQHLLRDTYMVLLKKDEEGNWTLFREIATSTVNN